MKIRNLLEAAFETNIVISPNEMNTLERRTYERIKNGKVNIDTADDREIEIILDLIDLGVLDQDGNIVQDGNDMVSDFERELPDDNTELEFNDSEFDLDDDSSENSDIDFTLFRNN
jgi:hypothetical protein